nr:DNA-directed DNA polymerase [Tanacetum cinerariifolium]
PSFLLGRPFLKIARINICVHEDTLTIEFDGQVIKFNTYDFMTYPGTEYLVFIIVVIDSLVQKVFELNDEDSLKIESAYDGSGKERNPETSRYRYYLSDFRQQMGFHQIPVAPEDQEKTTFTFSFGTFAFRRMPFGLCNTPATFQRCMVSIFSEYVEDIIEVFMDDFTVHGNILGHIVSAKRLEVDKDKIDVIKSLPYPKHMREVRSFLGHAGFYRRFIKDFSKTSQPLFRLLQKDVAFEFDDDCKVAFDKLKEVLISSPIIQPLDWNLPFKIMSDASNYAVGVVFRQRVEKSAHVIYYALRTLDSAQCNYLATEKELLAIVFALEKF